MDLRLEFKAIIVQRLIDLEKDKAKIGNTGSRSSEIALDWINGLIKINQKFLERL